MLFTSEVCLPEVMKQQESQNLEKEKQTEEPDNQDVFLSITNQKDQDIIPYMCFYNGLSFLKRLPTLDEISDESKSIDLEAGFKVKDSFVQLQGEPGSDKSKCKTDL